jgi:hypothetical protein
MINTIKSLSILLITSKLSSAEASEQLGKMYYQQLKLTHYQQLDRTTAGSMVDSLIPTTAWKYHQQLGPYHSSNLKTAGKYRWLPGPDDI